MTVVCTLNVNGSEWITYASKWNYDNSHACIDMTVVCTSNAYGSDCNNDTGHSCIYYIAIACTSNAYGSK